jgi:hypothetical protein
MRAFAGEPSLSLSIRPRNGEPNFPATAREVLNADGFRGLENGSDFYLTDGASLLHLDYEKRRGEARLAPSFFRKPLLLRQNFWAFGLLKLLRQEGIFSLHAAGLIADDGKGVLLIGESGSGKSTLAIGLIRRGWRYLSDDAVLLQSRPEGVEALPLRRHFYVDSAAAGEYADLGFGGERPDRSGGRRKRVAVEAAYPGQRVPACTPRLLLFPRIVSQTHGVLIPLDRLDALRRLVAQSGSQLFDRATSARHLAVLRELVRQAAAYELVAGSDLKKDPMELVRLLGEAKGEKQCPASS